MEDEMSEDEREGLRGGWEDFIVAEKGEGPSNQKSIAEIFHPKLEDAPTPPHWSPTQGSPADATTNLGKRRLVTGDEESASPKQRKITKSAFGQSLLRQEKLRDLGLATTSTRRDGKAVGPRISSSMEDTIKSGKSAEIKPDLSSNGEDVQLGRSDWACQKCTFVNLMDHGRCGECFPSIPRSPS